MDYRLYFMDHNGRHIDWFEPIRAENDVLAAEQATRLRCEKPLELWDRGRKISSFATV